MHKKLFATAVAVAVIGITALTGSAASAVEVDPYTPVTPTEPSLAGSLTSSDCAGDVPWIDYKVVLTDPDNQSTSDTAVLHIEGSGQSVDLPLGTLAGGSLSGRILWPGASVDGNGEANGWPGWTKDSSGAWVETDGNYAWTRGPIQATIVVNPEISVPLSYPAATMECANPEALAAGVETAPEELALTGSTVSWIAVGAGVGALALGGGLMAARRRRVHN